MPVPNRITVEKEPNKKQRRWSLLGILSKKKKSKSSQESIDFCPYDGKINRNVAKNNYLERSDSNDCIIQQYKCSPRPIKRCNSMQHTSPLSACSSVIGRPSSSDWRLSQQSVYSNSSSGVCYSDTGLYKNGTAVRKTYENGYTSPYSKPVRCSSEVGQYKTDSISKSARYANCSVPAPKKLIGKKIPPPPPPRNPNIKAVFYFDNNRLVSRESDSNYFSLSSDGYSPTYQLGESNTLDDDVFGYDDYYSNCFKSKIEEPPRSRRPIQMVDAETLSSECAKKKQPKKQTAEEAIRELEDIYNSLGLSDDDDLLDRAERRDLPTAHQNMRYLQSTADEADSKTCDKKVVARSPRRSGVPDVVADDMAYRRLNRRESKKHSSVFTGSFLLVLPSAYNIDKNSTVAGEPDVTLDDVVYRSRKRNRNFLRIPDRQPPFGIPLGPIVGAAPSDYLHAVPEGRYKPTFHSRRTPDTVEDDLAFRNLRKDGCKTGGVYFNMSFVHRDRFRINGAVIPGIINKLIKDDAHWIVKDPLAVDRPTANKRTDVMVVKVDRCKPIVLTGFTLDEADRMSKSLICTKLPRSLREHEPHKKRLSDRRTISNSVRTNNPPAPYVVQLKASRPRTDIPLTAQPPVKRSLINEGTVNEAIETTTGQPRIDQVTTSLDDTDVVPVCIKGHSSFRELIQREYANRYSSEPIDSDSLSLVVQGDCRRCTSTELPVTDTETNNMSTPTEKIVGHGTETDEGHCVVSAVPNDVSAPDERHRQDGAQTESLKSSTSVTALVPWSAGTACPTAQTPGYLEVCLYLTVCLYQLFSVNTYSTLIAFILLVALHICRRNSR
ncbi:uncharacterized protein LOC126908434 [Daktulosphaira vitifoliae]|uniref:uncharacterized protein LOC126908434 n=1 Tax=Daktulosphaira vitifoliae TaxID=58002 RepID=UPI0021A98A30|nr:uncharacterized protein LOC126908434 [Daktulosphaira vitifoliae]XP_050546447.1 uncharacterized protein LOC126908434 [Daktulosphaira vitifoliae]XP_050546448.1 uncharacterized protein LOC126908434 [Daktulosphaira vitifoliae]